DVSPGVDRPPVMPEDPYAYVVAAFQALPSPNYVHGPEEPEQAPPSHVYIPYVPEPVYPEYIPPKDDVFPAEEQPLPVAASPTADSPGYIPEFLAMHIPPPSPLTPLSSSLPQIPSPTLPASPPIIPIPLHAASPPLQLLSSDRRADRPEVTLPPRKRLSIVHCPGYEAGESSAATAARPIEGRRADYGFVDYVEAEIRRRISEDIGYGIRDTWIEPRDVAEEEALTTLEGVNTRVTELAAVQEQDTQDIYRVMEDTQGRQTEIFQRVEALVYDNQYHYETGRLVDQDVIVSREAWAHCIGLSSAVHFELQGYMTHTWVQDQRIDAQDTLIATLTTQLSSLQGHLATALGEIRALQTREQARAGAPEGAENGTKESGPKANYKVKPGATSNPNQAPSTTTTTVTYAQLQAMIDQGVNAALAVRNANRTGDDSHTSRTGVRRTERWFERMETVFRISNCLAENEVMFATCTLLAGALMWWNSHVRIVGNDAAYVMTWIELKKKMANKYCPRNEMKKIETEFWNLEVQGTDVTRYNQCFQELALLCVRTCLEESDRVERYIGGLPESIYGSVAASKPKTMQEATDMATGLMDKKIRTYAERQAANNRKFEDTS
nr:reverse transcriptase domain-containing protein [Tanacetum cinerariifolium]